MDTWLGDYLNAPTVVPSTMVGAFVLALLRGWLLPRKIVEDIRGDRDSRLADKDREIERLTKDKDRWRDAWIAAEEGRRIAAEQTLSLVQGLQRTTRVLEEKILPTEVDGERGGSTGSQHGGGPGAEGDVADGGGRGHGAGGCAV